MYHNLKYCNDIYLFLFFWLKNILCSQSRLCVFGFQTLARGTTLHHTVVVRFREVDGEWGVSCKYNL